MKTKNIAGIILAAGMALVSLTSCQERLIRFTKGEAVKFTAGSAGLWTKAYYEDVSSPVAGQTVPIYWEEGDLVRIFCEECGSPEIGDPDSRYADYVVTGFGETMSQAHLAQQTETILRWGSEDMHNFYAVYPIPSNKGDFPAMTGDAAELKASVPQTIAAGEEESGVIKPDFNCQYLVAKNSVKGWSGGNEEGVFLNFVPLTTAIQFTIKNGSGKKLDIDGIELISEGHNLSGMFTANLDKEFWTGQYPVCTPASGTKNVMMDFRGPEKEGYVSIENSKDASLTFTMFLMPCYEKNEKEELESVDINDITFKLYKSDGSWVSTKLAYNDANKTGVPFPNHKMTYVTGLLVPDGAQWQVKYSTEIAPWSETDDPEKSSREYISSPFVTSWTVGYEEPNKMMYKYNYTLDIQGQLEFDHNGTNGGKTTLNITSQREYNHGIPRSVIWHMEYWDETMNDWAVAKANTLIGGLVTIDPVIGTGDEIETDQSEIKMSVAAAAGSASQSHNYRLQNATPKSTDKNYPYDLSMHDIYGNLRSNPVTANSYVINAPGWYAIPLVYGNGIDFNKAPGGGVNSTAFNPGGEDTPSATFLPRFKNGKGEPITSPYIDQDLEETALSGWSAFPLWQDVAGAAIVTDASANCFVVDASTAKNTHHLDGMSGQCGYVIFQVNQSTLTQGNAVIAVKDGDDIVWSWHIWVTDNDLSTKRWTNSYNQTVEALPISLGWTDLDVSGNKEYWEGKSVKMRVVQNGSKTGLEFTVVRKEESTELSDEGSAPYFQWGRKDPFLRVFNNGSGWGEPAEDEVTVHSGYEPLDKLSKTPSTDYDIAYSIKNPNVAINLDGTGWYREELVSGDACWYYNLWSAVNKKLGTGATGFSSRPVKTIYDPCPPGFQVPQGNTFPVSPEFFFHFSGARAHETMFFNIDNYGTYGYYWTACPAAAYDGMYSRAGAESGTIKITNGNSMVSTSGLSIRPVKE